MSSGTKIALAIITLFVSVLVLYYGFIMPTPEPVRLAAGGAGGEEAVPRDPTAPAEAEDDGAVADEPAAEADRRTVSTPASVLARDEAEVASVTIPPAEAARLHAASDVLTGAGGGSTRLPAMRVAEQPVTAVSPDPEAGAPGDADAATAEPLADASPPHEDPATDTGAGGAREPAAPPASDEDARETAQPRGSTTNAVPPRYASYVVQEGDTMTSIAARWFGDERKWDLIAKANLVDPRRLRIGQVLRLPPRDTSRAPVTRRTGADLRTYTVRSGDTLTAIAETVYDDPARWRDLYEANRTLIGANADDLYVGMKLTVPPLGSGDVR